MKDWRTNSVDLDEVAHYEPPHQDLSCLQIQLFSSLVLNPVALRKAKIVYALRKCNRVKELKERTYTLCEQILSREPPLKRECHCSIKFPVKMESCFCYREQQLLL